MHCDAACIKTMKSIICKKCGERVMPNGKQMWLKLAVNSARSRCCTSKDTKSGCEFSMCVHSSCTQ